MLYHKLLSVHFCTIESGAQARRSFTGEDLKKKKKEKKEKKVIHKPRVENNLRVEVLNN